MLKYVAMVSVPRSVYPLLVGFITGRPEIASAHPDGVISWSMESRWVLHHDIESALSNRLKPGRNASQNYGVYPGRKIQEVLRSANVRVPGDESQPLIIKITGSDFIQTSSRGLADLSSLVF